MKWIRSHDLRMIPRSILEQSENKDLDIEVVQATAQKALENPLIWALYGLNDEGKIDRVMTGYFNFMDSHVWIDELYNCKDLLDDEDLKEALRSLQKRYGARGVKRFTLQAVPL